MALPPYLSTKKTLCRWDCNLQDMKNRKSFLGKTHSKKSREKISKNLKGKPSWNKGLKGFRAGEKRDWMPKGEKHWSFGKKNLKTTGEKHYRWIKDRTLLKGRHDRNFHDPDYKKWRIEVYKRDNYKCKIENKDCRGRIEAHHILVWRDYPELRYQVNNGITLCHAHHPRKRAEEKRLSPYFKELVSVSKK